MLTDVPSATAAACRCWAAGSSTTFVPVPAQTAFCGYWRRDERTTPPPQPIDLLLEGSWLLHKAKAGARGIEVGGAIMSVPHHQLASAHYTMLADCRPTSSIDT